MRLQGPQPTIKAKTKGFVMIALTKHARKRARQRCPDLSENGFRDLAEFVMNCGKVISCKDGSIRYRFSGKTYVIDKRGEKPRVVTVF